MITSFRRLAWFGILSLALGPSATFANTFMAGDVFASVTPTGGNGEVLWYRADGGGVYQLQPQSPLDTNMKSTTAGSSFDSSGNLYVTQGTFNEASPNPAASAVTKFSDTGALMGTFGTGYNADPESIVFDNSGNAFVGQADGTHHLLEFNSSGALINTFDPAVVPPERGTDWIDLASDQHTIYYTSEGNKIKRFDTATNTQLSDFATNLGGASDSLFALRLLPDGSLLVADQSTVLHVDSGGIGHAYLTLSNPTNGFIALSLDSDGQSFWAGDSVHGTLYKVNIATGVVESTIIVGTPGFNGGILNGVSVFQGFPTSEVPEPSQLAVTFALCGLLLAWRRWRKPQTGENI